jgi:cell division septation protein DedD
MSEPASPVSRKTHLHHRLVGLAVLAAVAAVAVPLILDFSDGDGPSLGGDVVPAKPPGLRVEEISLAPPPAAPGQGDQPAAAAPADPSRAPQAWAVKVGSFSSEENALALRDQLRGKGFNAFLEQTTVEGKALLRVYVGPDMQKGRSEQLRDRLAREFDLREAVVVGYN